MRNKDLASPIAGGLRGIRRSVSSSVFTGRSAAPQNDGDSISTNLITQNSLTLNSVSLQLSGIKEQVRSLNTSLESIKNNLELSDSLEKRKQAEKERREALLAEQGLREGAEGSLEKKIQFALLTPVRRVANFTKGILSRITDSLLFLAGGWLVDQTLTFFRLTSEENVEGLKKFKEQLVANLLIIGGLVFYNCWFRKSLRSDKNSWCNFIKSWCIRYFNKTFSVFYLHLLLETFLSLKIYYLVEFWE